MYYSIIYEGTILIKGFFHWLLKLNIWHLCPNSRQNWGLTLILVTSNMWCWHLVSTGCTSLYYATIFRGHVLVVYEFNIWRHVWILVAFFYFIEYNEYFRLNTSNILWRYVGWFISFATWLCRWNSDGNIDLSRITFQRGIIRRNHWLCFLELLCFDMGSLYRFLGSYWGSIWIKFLFNFCHRPRTPL